MALSTIDQLNTYEYVYNDAEVEKMLSDYFDVMDISDEQKKERVKAAKDIRNVLLFLFSLVSTAYEYEYFSMEYVLGQFRAEYAKILLDYGKMTVYTEKYFTEVTKNIVETTLNRFNPEQKDYWTSDERAITVAQDEANSILNYSDLQNALDRGFTKKTWVTERDSRVRKTHREVDNKTIPIEDYFHFPDCDGLCPHDEVNLTAQEVARCRCTLKFS